MNQLLYEECKTAKGIERRKGGEKEVKSYIGLNIAGRSLAPRYFATSLKVSLPIYIEFVVRRNVNLVNLFV
jgi:hypothetical protein